MHQREHGVERKQKSPSNNGCPMPSNSILVFTLDFFFIPEINMENSFLTDLLYGQNVVPE